MATTRSEEEVSHTPPSDLAAPAPKKGVVDNDSAATRNSAAVPAPSPPRTSTMATLPPPPPTPLVAADASQEGVSDEEMPIPSAPAAGMDASLPPPPPKAGGSGVGERTAAGSGGAGYKPPSWGLMTAPTASGLSLTVLKGGIEVASISLDNRAHVLLGRQQGVVDVLLEHPSISRKHAFIQHGQKGSLFLFDNGSTHGCAVNKQKIPPKEFHRLHVGDVIKFGESTRLYALEGPEELRPVEYESENLRNLRLQAGRKQLAVKLAKIKSGAAGDGKGGDSGEFGISWGFDEDAVAEEEDEEEGMEGADGEVELPDYLKTEAQKRRRRDMKMGLTEDSVHKRDAKLFEKLQLKLTKVEHLLTENERITAKEGGQGGLTEGQQAQLARNDKAISGVRLQIEEIEETIRSKNKARERGQEEKEGGKADDGEGDAKGAGEGDEDDEYYDRTIPARKAAGGAASKKAEMRARRFAPKDKTKKMVSPADDTTTVVAAAAVTVGGRGRVGTDDGQGSAPQSLEALTRRAEVVADDLERAEEGLAELEAEELEEEEEEEAAKPGGAVADSAPAVDPLDMFMTSNRKNERRQAIARLTALRESLRGEQSRLKLMVKAARPSLPTLKPAAAAAIVPAAAAVAAAVPKEGGARSGTPAASSPPKTTVVPTDSSEGGKPTASDRLKGTAAVGGGADKDPVDRPAQSPTTSASMAAPAAMPRRPAPAPAAGAAAGEPTTASAAAAAAAAAAGSVFRDGAQGSRNGDGEESMPASAERAGEDPKRSGVKRRGTPVGAAMLPPPPAKRPQQRDKETSPVGGGGKQDSAPPGVPAEKRLVRGPAAMPPPPGKLSAGGVGGPQVGTAGGRGGAAEGNEAGNNAAGSSRGGQGAAVDKAAASDGVLEGGDADWVPPKGQAGDGRTPLNLKFGY